MRTSITAGGQLVTFDPRMRAVRAVMRSMTIHADYLHQHYQLVNGALSNTVYKHSQ
jgi:hypothetical protein